ncbi:MAG: hypothetical protein HN742_14610 [Lentisphaerae bacterium]|jgi:UDP-2,3-diacylglucosamine hydrolase|nr:hypothetical protein [Lentisphaerota bacterium]MBT4816321.1 hypothetical protein [Lentisphaerota bacterium]MBT5607477.1 hypothetical protein [Lentisphaerota bacterium]MBT7055757.1 hypothetical protein [Lentisphaerota bacterium]MBT7843108.1 hypothetical protein [Lentisphaerota bacterium]
MILLADSHVSSDAIPATPFFDTLQAIARTDEDVVFLGDIFELWVGLPRYETEVHQRFLAWCTEQKEEREIGFVEGNHEFFVIDAHRDAFSWGTAERWLDDGGVLFLHGDTINREDTGYTRLRRALKNGCIKALMHWIPFGPRIAQWVKGILNKHKPANADRFPDAAVTAFAEETSEEDVRVIFSGHFHTSRRHASPHGPDVFIVPAWKFDHEVARYDPDTGEFSVFKLGELG